MSSSTPACSASSDALCHEIRFQSLFDQGRSLSFPCDSSGEVSLDRLSERARNNYQYVRATVGREYATPAINTRSQ